MHELERGSTTIKLWKEVKRKRVRIPDLVCVHCGLRVESRAKKEPQLSLSHSNTDAERAWDFGFVDDDLIAFPVAVAVDERAWHDGRLESWSYWHERTWMKWEVQGAINYVPVRSFRSTAHKRAATKGVTEGSENFLIWAAVFSTRKGTVESVVGRGVKIRRSSDNHAYTWQIPEGETIFVGVGETIDENQAIAGSVSPSTAAELRCTGHLSDGHINKLLQSKERTQRFTGVKLARLLRDGSHADSIRELTQDPEEDIYIRLEGASYLASALANPPPICSGRTWAAPTSRISLRQSSRWVRRRRPPRRFSVGYWRSPRIPTSVRRGRLEFEPIWWRTCRTQASPGIC